MIVEEKMMKRQKLLIYSGATALCFYQEISKARNPTSGKCLDDTRISNGK